MNCFAANLTNRNFGFRLAVLSVALFAIIILAACGGSDNPPEAESDNMSGSVQNQGGPREIPVSGSLIFPNTAFLSFDSPGIVGEIFVNEGDTVQIGQPLASLDAHSVAQLQNVVALSQVRVTTAENNLGALLLDPMITIASAELEVASAEVAAHEAQKALENLQQRPGINSEAARLAVAQAEIALNDAQERLDFLLTPEQIAVSAAEAQVAAARVEVDAAQEAYDDIKDGNFPEEILRDARNGVAFATTALEVATRNKSDAEANAQNALLQAEEAEHIARESYMSLFKYWFGTELNDAELQMTSQEVIAQWGIDLDETFHRFNPEYVDMEPTRDDPDTRWNELMIWARLNLSIDFFSVVPTCADEERLPRNHRCITRELQQGYDGFDKARDALAAARNNLDTTAESAEDAVSAAEATLSDARDALEEIEDGPDASLVESAEKRLQLAKATLQEAEEDLAELTVDIDPLNVALARAALAQAEVAFQEANDALDLSNDDELYIQQATKSVELAAAALVNADAALSVAHSLQADRVSAAESELALAQTALADALEALDGAVVSAPIGGIVSVVNIEVDDPVNDVLTVMEITATDVVEIAGVIDAAGRRFVQEGASAVVNIESVGDTSLSGSVVFISKEARTERGIISYAVRIQVEVPPGVIVPITLSPASAVIMGSGSATLRGDSHPSAGQRVPVIAAQLRPNHVFTATPH